MDFPIPLFPYSLIPLFPYSPIPIFPYSHISLFPYSHIPIFPLCLSNLSTYQLFYLKPKCKYHNFLYNVHGKSFECADYNFYLCLNIYILIEDNN